MPAELTREQILEQVAEAARLYDQAKQRPGVAEAAKRRAEALCTNLANSIRAQIEREDDEELTSRQGQSGQLEEQSREVPRRAKGAREAKESAQAAETTTDSQTNGVAATDKSNEVGLDGVAATDKSNEVGLDGVATTDKSNEVGLENHNGDSCRENGKSNDTLESRMDKCHGHNGRACTEAPKAKQRNTKRDEIRNTPKWSLDYSRFEAMLTSSDDEEPGKAEEGMQPREVRQLAHRLAGVVDDVRRVSPLISDTQTSRSGPDAVIDVRPGESFTIQTSRSPSEALDVMD
eukprot:TRINITY_DN7009_c0_g1_i1.p1 TRINITY_DN7009_c0_g1~~TRINITY_DN7009_c0_g1_i1.p1  ORF type:complete len:291 (-),score=65.77 TRINITY_DN7009_c0_g1_i1:12-884(-)